MAKARDVARAAFPELSFDFTFHDLKAKGISDLEGSILDKQKFQGIKQRHKLRYMIAKLRLCQ